MPSTVSPVARPLTLTLPTIVPGVARLNEISLPDAVSATVSPTITGLGAGVGVGIGIGVGAGSSVPPPPQATSIAAAAAAALSLNNVQRIHFSIGWIEQLLPMRGVRIVEVAADTPTRDELDACAMAFDCLTFAYGIVCAATRCCVRIAAPRSKA